MTTIKFDRSVKYNGIRYSAHEAFRVDDADVDELKKSGATVLSVEPTTPPVSESEGEDSEECEDSQEGEDSEDVAKLREDLLEYTVPELTKFAQEHDIYLQGKTRKADIYNIIVASLK